MNDSTQKNYSLAAVALGVACLAGGYFLYSNFWVNYSAAQIQYVNTQTENENLKNALASVQTFLEGYKNQDKNISLTKLALPVQAPDMANLLSSIADLAGQSGVAMANVQISEPEDKLGVENSIQVQQIGLSASGGYAPFRDFVFRLEEHLRLIDVYQITVTSDSSGSPLLKFQIKLRTYFQK